MKTEQKAVLIGTIVTVIISYTGRLLTQSGMAWYRTINLPWLTPAPWIFPIAWSTIYICTLACIYLSYQVIPKHELRLVSTIFWCNAILNGLWSYLFFYAHYTAIACFDAGALTLSVYLIMLLIWKNTKLGSVLLIPYAAWTTFATYLNYLIVTLN